MTTPTPFPRSQGLRQHPFRVVMDYANTLSAYSQGLRQHDENETVHITVLSLFRRGPSIFVFF